MSFEPGARVGQYDILSELGRGGMATVYRASQPSMQREVAIKVLPPQFLHDQTFLARFKNEARVIARLEHLHILPVYDFGEADGCPYIVMRLMPGGSVDELLRNGPLRPAECARIISQVGSALDHAHREQVCHRDIKPANLLLDEQHNAYLADFGIAKVMEASRLATGTQVVGTPKYMAPEQARGQMPTARSDQYALGAVAYELLIGRAPFVAEDFVAVLYKHATEPLPDIGATAPGLPAATVLQKIIARAMAKQPDERYASAGEFAAALQAWADQVQTPGRGGEAVHPLAAPKPDRDVSPVARSAPNTEPTAINPDTAPEVSSRDESTPAACNVPASTGARLGAFGIDAAAALLLLALAGATGREAAGLIALMAIFGYHAFALRSQAMATPGKRLVGLIVVDRGGQRLSLGRAAARTLLLALVHLPLLTALAPFFDRHNRGLHDRLAGTLVLDRARYRPEAWDVSALSAGVKSRLSMVAAALLLLMALSAVLSPEGRKGRQAKSLEMPAEFDGLRLAIEDYWQTEGRAPDYGDLGLEGPVPVLDGAARLELGADGRIRVLLNRSGGGQLAFALIPQLKDGTVSWSCERGRAPGRLLPKLCR